MTDCPETKNDRDSYIADLARASHRADAALIRAFDEGSADLTGLEHGPGQMVGMPLDQAERYMEGLAILDKALAWSEPRVEAVGGRDG